jgi:predicted transcriptional regulator of viral defense system
VVVAEAEPLVVAFARGQQGVITSRQLERAGMSAGWVRNRLKTGSLRRLHRGVYLVGPLETPHTAPMAAVLATDGLISLYPDPPLGPRPRRRHPPARHPRHLRG